MPELTRRRYPKPATNAGTFTMATCMPARSRSGRATRTTPIPGSGDAASIPDLTRANAAAAPQPASLDEARAGFEEAWKVFLAAWTGADFQEWRDQRDWTAKKYALWDAGKRLEPPS